MRHMMILALCVTLCGCGLELLGGAAIQSGMQADQAKRAMGTLQHAQSTASRLPAEQAIQAYRADKGVNPPSLDVLIQEGYLTEAPKLPDGTPCGYDPEAGVLLDSPAPPAQTAAPTSVMSAPGQDVGVLSQVEYALMKYKHAKGVYPQTLDQLTPDYLNPVPKTASGHGLVYDPAQGKVYHPSYFIQSPAGQPQQSGPPQSGTMMDNYSNRQMEAADSLGL